MEIVVVVYFIFSQQPLISAKNFAFGHRYKNRCCKCCEVMPLNCELSVPLTYWLTDRLLLPPLILVAFVCLWQKSLVIRREIYNNSNNNVRCSAKRIPAGKLTFLRQVAVILQVCELLGVNFEKHLNELQKHSFCISNLFHVVLMLFIVQ